MYSVPPNVAGSWTPRPKAVTSGLTVPEFPLLSASLAITAPGRLGSWLGGWSIPMLSVPLLSGE